MPEETVEVIQFDSLRENETGRERLPQFKLALRCMRIARRRAARDQEKCKK